MHRAAPAADAFPEVAHLVELGYHDPLDAAALRAAQQQAQQAQLTEVDALLSSGHAAAAIVRLEQLTAESPAWTAPLRRLAHAYARAGRPADALACLDQLQAQGVEHAELALLRAAVYLQQRRLAAARDEAQYAKCLEDPLPAADALLGEIAYRQGNLTLADAAYRAAIDADAANVQALIGQAAVCLRRGELEQAVESSLAALEQNLQAPLAHYRFGLALLKLERWPEARIALETCAALDGNLAGPHRFLAFISQASGDAPRAAEDRRRGRAVVQQRRTKRLRAEAADTSAPTS